MLIEITRPYGGQEGRRVKPGTRFWVTGVSRSSPPEGVRTMERVRFGQLQRMGLADQVQDGAGRAAPGARPRPTPADPEPRSRELPPRRTKVEPDSNAPNPRREAQARTPAKEAAEGEEGPTRPRRGGRAGADPQSSSSEVVRQSGSVTLRQRGTRRDRTSGGSPSTTPSSASAGQTSSTPATSAGGASTTEPGDSAAFA